MADQFTQQIALLITANADGAISVVKGFTNQATSEFSKTEQAAAQSGGNAGKSYGANLASGLSSAISPLQATFATLGAGFFLKGAVTDAVQLNVAGAALAAQFKATGDQAGASVSGVENLATSIEKTQAIFRGTVEQGAAVLGTFTAIQNQAGAGNNIYDRTLSIAAGVSNTFGRSYDTVVTQLGRALENPQAGTQALQRSGITLSQQDKQRIIDLEKQGDLLGSQKALLDALSNRGYVQQGAAIAAANPLQQFGVASTELKTKIGEDLLPAATEILDVFKGIFGAVEVLPGPIRQTAELMTVLSLTALPLIRLQQVFSALRAVGGSTQSGAAEEATAVATATDQEAAAATAAVESNTALTTQLGLFDEEAAGLTTTLDASTSQLSLFSADADTTTTSVDALTASYVGLNEQLSLIPEEAAVAGPALEGVGGAGAAGAAGGALGGAAKTGEDTALPLEEGSVATGLGAKLAGGLTADASLSLGTVAAGAAAFYVSYKATMDLIGPSHATWQTLSTDTQRVASDMEDISKKSLAGKLLDLGGMAQDTTDIKDLNSGLNQLLQSQGVTAASAKFEDISHSLEAMGVPASTVTELLLPFEHNLEDAVTAEAAAASNTDDLSTAFSNFATQLQGVKAELTVADDFDTLSTAVKKLKADQADAAGTGEKYATAQKAVTSAFETASQQERTTRDDQGALTDAYTNLTDAQNRVVTSTNQLAEARQALALYDSPRGDLERSLALDAINRRVVTTPAESDQKQLDLLKFGDDQVTKKQQLQDAVLSASNSQRDAYKSEGDAQRAILDANSKIHDDAVKQKQDFDNIGSAVKNLKKVHSDAASAIGEDQRKVQEAEIQTATDIANDTSATTDQYDKWLKKLKLIADAYAPGSPLAKNIDSFMKTVLAGQNNAAHPILPGSGSVGPHSSPPGSSALTAGNLVYNPGPPAAKGVDTQTPVVVGTNAGNAFGHPARADGGPVKKGLAYLIGERGPELWEPNVDGQVHSNGSSPRGLPRTPGSGAPSAPPVEVHHHEQTVTQENHFHGATPALSDLDFANRELGWRMSRGGRR